MKTYRDAINYLFSLFDAKKIDAETVIRATDKVMAEHLEISAHIRYVNECHCLSACSVWPISYLNKLIGQ